MTKEKHKPIIETIINTTALALTSAGVMQATGEGFTWDLLIKGFVLVMFGAGLEFFKYWGRREKYW
ncbi:MAG: hypothetical protein CMI54_01845 [Parcubacteria group bacterium]|nr:hypothetical protein [Parcubacteria group bacterium]|tara:strand:+ start:5048 stop:5245 length:198 start_codon:yes stop_codon:yes gene_type:complete